MIKKLITILFLFPLAAVAQQPPELSKWEATSKKVTIIRDNWGIPHIYGKTDADAVFGLMYTQCEDNFSRLEKNYLYQMGRQAEADGESILYEDLQLQLIADTADAIKEYQSSPASFKVLLDAFADGINYYLYKHPETKPKVLKRFQPWFALMFTDGSVSATRTGGINLNETKQFYTKDNAGALTSANYEAKTAVADAERETGSNGFAISRSRSASGNAMLYINPHVPFYFRSEVHIVSEEGLNAYGAVTWGQFFIYQGFNEHCGWMHTTSDADVADLYEEKMVKRDNQWFYQYDGQLKPVTTRKIRLSYLKDDNQTPREITGYYTHHGPVLGSRNGRWLSLKANNRSYDALLESWLITKANTFDEYKKAMNLLSNASNNTVYADDQGNIALWYGNFVPKRSPVLDWTQPVDGTRSTTEWQGVHPLDEIVHIYNPSTGWIQNCNATPYAAAGTASPLKSKYPSYMAPDGQNFRSVTAIRLLTDAKKISLDDLIKKGYDRYLAAFDLLLPPLFKAYGEAPDSTKKKLTEPIGLLKAWDKHAAVNSVATTLAVEWAARMLTGMPRATSSEMATYQTERMSKMVSNTSAAVQLQYLADVVASLESRFENWKIPWGDINRYQRSADGKFHDDQPSIAVAQTSSALGQLPSFVSSSQNTKKRYGYSGNSFIAAVEFGPKLKARTIITGGQSFDPTSKHFTDQAEMFLEGRFKEVLFYKEDLAKHTERTYHPGE